MCQSNCCGPFWAIAIVVMQISALASPWYLWISRRGSSFCDYQTLMSWSHIHMKSVDGGLCDDDLGVDVDVNWRDGALCSTSATNCKPMEQTMDTAVAFASLSLIVGLVVAVLTMIVSCRAPVHGPNALTASRVPSQVARGLMWGGAALSMISVVAFASTFTHGYKEMFGECVGGDSCPAESLIGANSYWGDDDTTVRATFWMPVGYWAQLFVTGCYLFALCAWHSQRSADADRARHAQMMSARQQVQVVRPVQIYNLQQPQQYVQPQQPMQQPMQQQQWQQPQPVYAAPPVHQQPMAAAPPAYPVPQQTAEGFVTQKPM